jgi:hypothetical protein
MKKLPQTLPSTHHLATSASRRSKKDPLNTRSFLWQIILSYLAHGSMPSWGLPFETIAASILLKDRDGDKKHRPTEDEKENSLP